MLYRVMPIQICMQRITATQVTQVTQAIRAIIRMYQAAKCDF